MNVETEFRQQIEQNLEEKKALIEKLMSERSNDEQGGDIDAELVKKLSTLESANEELNRRLEESLSSASELKIQLSTTKKQRETETLTFNSQIDTLKADLQEMSEKSEQLSQKLSTSEAEKEGLIKEKTELEKNNERLQREIEEERSEKSLLREEYTKVEEQRVSAESRVSELGPLLEKTQEDLNEAKKQLERVSDEKDSTIAQLTSSLEGKEAEMTERNRLFEEKESKVVELMRLLEAKEIEAEKLVEERGEKDSKIVELTSSLEEKETEIKRLTEENRLSEEKNSKIVEEKEAEITRLTEEIRLSQNDERVAQLTSSLEELTEKARSVAEADAEKEAAFTEQIEALKGLLEDRTHSLNQFKSEKEKLMLKIDEVDREKERKEQELRDALSDLQSLVGEKLVLNQTLTRRDETLKKLTSKVNKQTEELERINGELTQKRKEAEELMNVRSYSIEVEKKFKELETTHEILSSEFEGWKNELASAKEKIVSFEEERQRSSKASSEEESRVSALTQELEQLKPLLQQQQEEIESLSKMKEVLDTEKESLADKTREASELSAQVKSLEEQISSVSMKLEVVEREKESAMKELQEAKDFLERDNKLLQEQVEQIQLQAQQPVGDDAGLPLRQKMATELIENQQKRIKHLQEHSTLQEEKIQDLKREIEKLVGQIELANVEAQMSKNQIQELLEVSFNASPSSTSENQASGGESEELKKKLNRMRQLLQGAHAQLKENAKKVTQTQQELTKYREENEVMRTKMDKLGHAEVSEESINSRVKEELGKILVTLESSQFQKDSENEKRIFELESELNEVRQKFESYRLRASALISGDNSGVPHSPASRREESQTEGEEASKSQTEVLLAELESVRSYTNTLQKENNQLRENNAQTQAQFSAKLTASERKLHQLGTKLQKLAQQHKALQEASQTKEQEFLEKIASLQEGKEKEIQTVTADKEEKIASLERKFQEYKEYATSKLQQQLMDISNLKDAKQVLEEKTAKYEAEAKAHEENDEYAWMEGREKREGEEEKGESKREERGGKGEEKGKREERKSKGHMMGRLSKARASGNASDDFFDFSEMQAKKEEELARATRKLVELTDALDATESTNKLLISQLALLKEEIRKQDQREKLESTVNLEYLRNIIIKYIQTGQHDSLFPVLKKILHFTPDEVKEIEAGRSRPAGWLW
eukprot:TRINITY_DN6612_c0_g1_i5.p1 TRINITY_DN6612_c0_g1~~TRINITY_DN6612_c0_g1_i5.p1  ORF type:complete len:1183 (+),score=438.05 TRINITY_DN6612_c0_g1_i5:1131-4679(+)